MIKSFAKGFVIGLASVSVVKLLEANNVLQNFYSLGSFMGIPYINLIVGGVLGAIINYYIFKS